MEIRTMNWFRARSVFCDLKSSSFSYNIATEMVKGRVDILTRICVVAKLTNVTL